VKHPTARIIAHNPKVAGSNPAPAIYESPDRVVLIGRGFVFWEQLGSDRRGELDGPVGLVVDGCDLEGVADVSEFGGVGVGERGTQVGYGVEHLEDLLGADAGRAA
jgi:hypothetical protein